MGEDEPHFSAVGKIQIQCKTFMRKSRKHGTLFTDRPIDRPTDRLTINDQNKA